MSQNEVINIIFAGVGGQGNILVSHLLAAAALAKGHNVRLTETFGAATRGGSVFSCVRIGEAGAPLPRKNSVQMIVGLEPLETMRQAIHYLKPGGFALVNTHKWVSVDVSTGRVDYPDVDGILNSLKRMGAKVASFDATIEAEELGNTRMMNIILLGGLMSLGILEIDKEFIFAEMDKLWKPAVVQANKVAFQKGFDIVSQHVSVQA